MGCGRVRGVLTGKGGQRVSLFSFLRWNPPLPDSSCPSIPQKKNGVVVYSYICVLLFCLSFPFSTTTTPHSFLSPSPKHIHHVFLGSTTRPKDRQPRVQAIPHEVNAAFISSVRHLQKHERTQMTDRKTNRPHGLGFFFGLLYLVVDVSRKIGVLTNYVTYPQLHFHSTVRPSH